MPFWTLVGLPISKLGFRLMAGVHAFVHEGGLSAVVPGPPASDGLGKEMMVDNRLVRLASKLTRQRGGPRVGDPAGTNNPEQRGGWVDPHTAVAVCHGAGLAWS